MAILKLRIFTSAIYDFSKSKSATFIEILSFFEIISNIWQWYCHSTSVSRFQPYSFKLNTCKGKWFYIKYDIYINQSNRYICGTYSNARDRKRKMWRERESIWIHKYLKKYTRQNSALLWGRNLVRNRAYQFSLFF